MLSFKPEDLISIGIATVVGPIAVTFPKALASGLMVDWISWSFCVVTCAVLIRELWAYKR